MCVSNPENDNKENVTRSLDAKFFECVVIFSDITKKKTHLMLFCRRFYAFLLSIVCMVDDLELMRNYY